MVSRAVFATMLVCGKKAGNTWNCKLQTMNTKVEKREHGLDLKPACTLLRAIVSDYDMYSCVGIQM